MNYIQLITNLCDLGKYLTWYINLMNRGRQRLSQRCLLQKYERHHIVPRSFGMGGELDGDNIALLTPREHFIAHLLLTKCTQGHLKYKMLHALQRLAGASHLTSWEYQRASLSTKHLPKTAEHKQRISEALTGKSKSDEHKHNLSVANTGHPGLTGDANPMFGKKGILHHNYGKPGPMTGKQHSPEAKQKIKQNHHQLKPMLGRKHTDATKALMSLNNAMRVDPYLAARVRWTVEERENQRIKMLGSNNSNAKRWRVTNLDTNVSVIVTDLKLFCNDHNWKYKSLMSMRSGGKPYKRHIIEILSD